MTNYFENKLSMLQKVLAYLVLKASQTSGVPAVGVLQTLLSNNINSILGYAATADADGTGYTVDKDNRRDALEAATFAVSTGVVSYAVMEDLNALMEKNDETEASQAVMRDNDIYIYSTTVSASATTIIGGDDAPGVLGDYNVTAADITNLADAQAAYLPYIQEPRLQINERATAREDMVRTFMENDEKVVKKLDKIMRSFISTNRSLYNGYKGARNIDDDGNTMTTPTYTGFAEPGNIVLVAELPYSAGQQFRFKNDGEVAITFGLSTTSDSMEGTPVTVEPNSENTRLSSNLNEDMNANFLLLQNEGDNPSGYRIWVTD